MTNAYVLTSLSGGVAPPIAEQPVEGRDRSHDWADIVTRIRAGQSSGIEELYGVLGRGLRYYLGRHLGAQDLEDRLHEILLIVVSAIQKGQVREPERIMGFVRTVAQRRVAAHIEKLVHSRKRENELTPDLDVADQRQNPEQLAATKQKADLMNSILAQMPERQREILVRFYSHEQTPEQICQEMSLTETQFRLAKSRAKAIFGTIGQNALRKPAVMEKPKQVAKCA
jgi:RNA polymerase sigma factor (sigma-70 family)